MYTVQLNKLRTTKAAKQKELADIMTKSIDAGKTPNEVDENSIKQLEKDIEQLEINEKRLEKLIAAGEKAANDATPAAGTTSEQGQKSANGDPKPAATVQANSLPKGIAFAKAMRAKAQSGLAARNGDYVSALDIAKSQNAPDVVISYLQKDALIGATTVKPMEALVDPLNIAGEFIELLRARTVFDKLASKMRRVPFNTKMAEQLTGGVAQWVGEGEAKPVTNPTFGSIKIDEHKLAAIAIFTDEFLRNSSPSADGVFLEDLLAAAAELIDNTFVGKAAGTDSMPAGLLHGVTAIAATGMDTASLDKDLGALTTQFLNNSKSLAGAHYIMSEVRANSMARLRDAMGNPYYRGMDAGINEKVLDGIPVLETERAPNEIIMIKPSELLLADDGGVEVAYSSEATIVNGETAVSLWQQNMNAIRVERYLTWIKRRAKSVSFINYADTLQP